MKQQLQMVGEPRNRNGAFAAIEDAIAAIRAGKMVIVVDDEDRENEGDRGLICLAMTPERVDEREIPLMVPQNSSRFETAFA